MLSALVSERATLIMTGLSPIFPAATAASAARVALSGMPASAGAPIEAFPCRREPWHAMQGSTPLAVPCCTISAPRERAPCGAAAPSSIVVPGRIAESNNRNAGRVIFRLNPPWLATGQR